MRNWRIGYPNGMTLPGNSIPPEALPPGGSNLPAEDAQMLPVWCRHSISWTWVSEAAGYVCDDPTHGDGIPANQLGAIDVSCQPTYAHPPNKAQRAALLHEEVEIQAAEILERGRELGRGV